MSNVNLSKRQSLDLNLKSFKKMKSLFLMALFFSCLFSNQIPKIYAAPQVYSPIVEQGEFEVEYAGEYDFDRDEENDGKQKHTWSMGYGLTSRWFSEIGLEAEAENDDSEFKLESLVSENIFQLFEQGKYWIDAGIYAEFEFPLHDKGAFKQEYKLLLEKTTQNFTYRANIFIEQKFGSHANHNLEGGINALSKYHLSENFEPGFEYHSNYGKFNEGLAFNDQSHLIGPVIYGKVFKRFKYEVGYLFGVTEGARDGILKWIIEIEI